LHLPGKEFGANLILFHAYDTLVVAASETSGIRYYDYAAAARTEKHHLEPMAQQVKDAGLQCEVVVRPDWRRQILAFAREREIDRIVMARTRRALSASCLSVQWPRLS